jgi:hypothetical protein
MIVEPTPADPVVSPLTTLVLGCTMAASDWECPVGDRLRSRPGPFAFDARIALSL